MTYFLTTLFDAVQNSTSTAGGHTVFLRDILPEKAAQKRKRTPSNEDTKTPKKSKTDVEETPRSSRTKREEDPPRRRLVGWLGAAQAKVNAENAELEKIRLERLEARRAKLAHQDRETQELINKQGQRLNKAKTREPENNKKNDSPKAVIKTFQALNEDENVKEEDCHSPPPHKDTKQRPCDEEPATLNKPLGTSTF